MVGRRWPLLPLCLLTLGFASAIEGPAAADAYLPPRCVEETVYSVDGAPVERDAQGRQLVHAGVTYVANARLQDNCRHVEGYRIWVSPDGEVDPAFIEANEDDMVYSYFDREPIGFLFRVTEFSPEGRATLWGEVDIWRSDGTLGTMQDCWGPTLYDADG